MSIRPIVGTGDNQRAEPPHQEASAGPPPKPVDSPLASQLPDWDLVPNDMLLVRRRPNRP